MASATDVAQYFLYLDIQNDDSEGISNLKLQKLTYYAQGFYMALNGGETLFDEQIEAWQHGPVVPVLYHDYKKYSSSAIPATEIDTANFEKFTEEQRQLVEEVYEVFGPYSAWKLRQMTHEEAPWIDNEAHGGLIPREQLLSYFNTRI